MDEESKLKERLWQLIQERDALRGAIDKATRGIRAELADETQGPDETLGKIDMRVDELASVLPMSVSAG